MGTLQFTDPRTVAAYIDRFEERSVAPLQAYLWEDFFSDEPKVSRVRREELDMMIIDEDEDRLLIDAAIYTDHQKTDELQNVLVLTESQNQSEREENRWRTVVLVVLTDKLAANNLAKQIAGEAAVAFSVVK